MPKQKIRVFTAYAKSILKKSKPNNQDKKGYGLTYREQKQYFFNIKKNPFTGKRI